MINSTNKDWLPCESLRPTESYTRVVFRISAESRPIVGRYKSSNDSCEYDTFVDINGCFYEWRSPYFWRVF